MDSLILELDGCSSPAKLRGQVQRNPARNQTGNSETAARRRPSRHRVFQRVRRPGLQRTAGKWLHRRPAAPKTVRGREEFFAQTWFLCL